MTDPTQVAWYWAQVDRSSADGCWPWLTGTNGYGGRGVVYWRGRQMFAYRASWEIQNGRHVPDGMFVCHHCDNPVCVRPDHLFVGTPADNHRDMVEKGRAVFPVSPRGIEHHCATVPDALVRATRERYARGGVTAAALAAELGVSNVTVHNWVLGRVRVAAGGPMLTDDLKESA